MLENNENFCKYFQALKNLYEIYFVEPETEWKKNAKECARSHLCFIYPSHIITVFPEDNTFFFCFEDFN